MTLHILAIPFPAQGHMIPFLDLINNLATSHSNLSISITITILTTPHNLPYLTNLLSSHPSSITPVLLPFPSHPSIPPAIENTIHLPHSMRPFILALSRLHQPLLHWFHSHPAPPRLIISDIFCGWTHHLASQLNIKSLVFSPSSAFALSTMYFLWKDMPMRNNVNDENEVVLYHRLPNSPRYPWCQVSPLFRSYVGDDDPDSVLLKDSFLGNIQSWGLVVNTFSELEKPYLDYLRTELGHDRVWAVGPLLPHPDDSSTATKQRGGSSSVSVNDVVSWLDQRQKDKVVYVCFGSQTVLSNDQTVAIASGLEKSGVHFIWCMKGIEDNERDSCLSGLEDRTAGRGLVIKGWAPQVMILRHKAVGAFLTHCGWNSVLESVVGGVSLLAWPMTADQFVNATLLVEELKVAKKVCEGEKTVPDSDELEYQKTGVW
ncbi:hypothetical protein RIF29_10074 [Crotalaria pallida]|uniref:Glycosyltransferase N-terminal domain-containing protein n=1 Tax=Crotalaria pallida TaxID=3830 RepID=A0AAN9FVM2_CROPI